MVTNLNRSNGRSGSETERRHILIVDDERPILESLRDLLEDEFEVHTTTRGQEAVRLLGEYPVAVLLTDQRMPGMEGDELLSRAAECSLATRIMITGHADLNSVVRAVNRGHIYAYISKPWNPLELKITLSQAAQHYDLMKKYQRNGPQFSIKQTSHSCL